MPRSLQHNSGKTFCFRQRLLKRRKVSFKEFFSKRKTNQRLCSEPQLKESSCMLIQISLEICSLRGNRGRWEKGKRFRVLVADLCREVTCICFTVNEHNHWNSWVCSAQVKRYWLAQTSLRELSLLSWGRTGWKYDAKVPVLLLPWFAVFLLLILGLRTLTSLCVRKFSVWKWHWHSLSFISGLKIPYCIFLVTLLCSLLPWRIFATEIKLFLKKNIFCLYLHNISYCLILQGMINHL